MVNNKLETTPSDGNSKYQKLADSAYLEIESKPSIQEEANKLFEKATANRTNRRNLIIEAYAVAANISQVLSGYMEDNDLTVLHSWSNLGIDIGHPEVTVEKALQKDYESIFDIIDIASAADTLTPLFDATSKNEVLGIRPETYTETSEAFEAFIKGSLVALYKAANNRASEGNNDLYEVGLGIERLATLALATGKLSEYTKGQKEIELEKYSETKKVAPVDTIQADLYSGTTQGNWPAGF